MLRGAVTFLCCGLIVGSFTLAAGPNGWAADQSVARSISVMGYGEVKARPKQANIVIRLESLNESAAEALKNNRSKIDSIVEALSSFGIDENSIWISQVSIRPLASLSWREFREVEKVRRFFSEDEKVSNSDDQKTSDNTDFTVSNTMKITTTEISNLGLILDRLTGFETIRIEGIGFDYEELGELINRARQKAMENALAKAALLATSANLTLGKTRLVEENAIGTRAATNGTTRVQPVFDPDRFISPELETVSTSVFVIVELN